MTSPALFARLALLDGLIPATVGLLLASLAADVPDGQAVVELGSYKGKSTAYLAAGAGNVHVYAVDPWDQQPPPGTNGQDFYRFADPATRARFDEQLESVGLRSAVQAIQGYSADVAATYDGPPVGLLYVDGDHTEAGVAGDVAAWWPHLANPAVIVFDDYDSRPVNAGVAIVVTRLERHVAVKFADRLAIATIQGEDLPCLLNPAPTGSAATPPATTPAPAPEAPTPKRKPPTSTT